MSLFRTKPLEDMLAQAADSEKGLKRTLGAGNLIALGIGAIIGAGLFVRTAAAAGQAAGPAVTLAFVVAAVGCLFAGLCYAEFASMIPIAGSAYAYSYVTMGELVAWIIGWALIMEYALGAATVSIAWSEYLNRLLGGSIPYEWCHSPLSISNEGVRGIMNAPALIILVMLTLLLIKGTQESAIINMVIVFVKVSIVLVFIVIGWQYINGANYTPYFIPEGTPDVLNKDGSVHTSYKSWFRHGYGGVIGGAAIVFFAFIGFDAVSTAAQEAKNPKRDMPIGILGSLLICTILYILFGHVLTGVANWQEFADPNKGGEASVAYAIDHMAGHYEPIAYTMDANGNAIDAAGHIVDPRGTWVPKFAWLSTAVTIAILAGFSSVILVMLMGQSRVFYTMSKDGLIPGAFSTLHKKFKTPYKANMILFVFVGLFAAFVPGDLAGDLTSFGTLFAFVLVSIGVFIMRIKAPNIPRPFKTPFAPVVSVLGAAICLFMIVGLDLFTLQTAGIWMVIGLIIYFAYGRRKSKLHNPADIMPKASDFEKKD